MLKIAHIHPFRTVVFMLLLCSCSVASASESSDSSHSVARQWNEATLEAIRNDWARPVVHARNLFHVSAAMWDAWAAYDPNATAVFYSTSASSDNREAARDEAVSHAAYRLLSWRFQNSPGAEETLPTLNALMDELGYDRSNVSTAGDSPAALGNRIAQTIIDGSLEDGSNELNDYVNRWYLPVNDPLQPDRPGNPFISDPNRWQPLALEVFMDQAGRITATGTPEFLGPEWGAVTPFSLTDKDLSVHERGGFEYRVYHDPGAPPYLGGERDAEYKSGFEQVAIWSGYLDPSDGVMLDISPGARGNNTLGTNDGSGREINPATGEPYEPQVVPAGDYYRVLAEFWADGPDSETPPGHWFTLVNHVSDHPDLQKRLGGQGPMLNNLEWDVKVYLALGGTMHDVAIASWGVKGWYDYVRPISAIRYMCDKGQSSDPELNSYDPEGIGLHPGAIELITEESSSPGGRHEHLRQYKNLHVGKIALYAWRGPDFVADPKTDTAGTGWMHCEEWWPYQRPSFVTPPFAGYVSGHSTYSRAAAEVLTRLTGSEFFPGGMGEFLAPKNEFLVFEEGPSVDIRLQWATYQDAADECSLSRIYGGIHPTADDIPGRLMGAVIGIEAYEKAESLFGKNTVPDIQPLIDQLHEQLIEKLKDKPIHLKILP